MTENETNPVFVDRGGALTAELVAFAERTFICRDGETRAFYEEGGAQYPYLSYVYGHRGVEDRRDALIEFLPALLLNLKKAGATRLVWRSKPAFTYDDSSPDGSVRTILRARFACIDAEGNSVTVQETAEGDEIPFLGDVTPMEPYDSSKVGRQEMYGEVTPAPLGYDMIIEAKEEAILHCAMIIHSAVEAMNRAHNELTLSWEQSRDSVIVGIRRTLDNPGETPEQNHEEWMKYRVTEGWVYGTQKDPVAKTHPCMVPYAALGPFQQSKDAIFQAIVRTYFGLEV